MRTMRTTLLVAVALCCAWGPAPAQTHAEALERLSFLLGEWESTSTKLDTGEVSRASSSVDRILDGTWLRWKFVAHLEQGPFEILTLISYDEEAGRYAFYSINPRVREPRGHYGNWLDETTLRLKIKTEEEETWVDFLTGAQGRFNQVHARVTAAGERVVTRETTYSRRR